MSDRAVVTGVAGFIGSQIAERLLGMGLDVVGIDCLTDYYDISIKRQNLAGLHDHDGFTLIEEDINATDLRRALDGASAVYHQAAQAGVRASWGKEFDHYIHHNIAATQRILETAKEIPCVRIVYASSSSVYGDVETVPMKETDRPAPHSPYGVSKLAAEHMCRLYTRNFGVETVSLRYFTVFGPRQRPDMAMHRLIKAHMTDGTFNLFGDGTQTRDFTHVSDIVDANIAAAERGESGAVYNIGGGNFTDMNALIELIAELTGGKATINRTEKQRGDVRTTMADMTEAKRILQFNPKVNLADGLRSEIKWMEGLLSQSA